MKASILPSYVSGISTHKGQSFFATAKQEQHLTKEERAASLHNWNMQHRASIQRQRDIKKKYPNSKVIYV